MAGSARICYGRAKIDPGSFILTAEATTLGSVTVFRRLPVPKGSGSVGQRLISVQTAVWDSLTAVSGCKRDRSQPERRSWQASVL